MRFGFAPIVLSAFLAGCGQKVIISSSVRENSYFSPEAFALAEEFLEENTRIDFEFGNYREKTNHFDRFALVVQDFQERAEEVKGEQLKSIDYLIGKIEGELAKSGGEAAEIRDVLFDAKDLRERTIRNIEEEYKYRIGETETEKGLIHLLDNEMTKAQMKITEYDKALDELKATTRDEKILREIEDIEELKRSCKAHNTRSAAKTIVHEVGHLFGLWHTQQYVNDSYEDLAVSGLPNVMGYLNPVEGKYGFAFDKEQIRQIKDYLKKGKTYTDFRAAGFNLHDYTSKKAEENGWKLLEGIVN
ncbi:hypothetical protein CO038_00535 [Candidatus Pacearchaeota archaeon CG_4_9_14_0_2_um_filter_39_13]|nr:hypothetical protein [Candidatus Pacearchaeota archaeon]OIO42975.1 MAG: hypothetical protein AUJ64_03320 [Candidatus Pacearchaeota archaeon CG1_02_39_14]PJC45042.1 MAG: hypothetical protein CO038_00535 [Candidatus Pacearchaeota archaeon CG_4_9_14_0_2_um_filter_39_13]